MLDSVSEWIVPCIVAAAISAHSYKKKKLTISGAIAAFLVGIFHFHAGIRFTATLLFFFFSSSKLTKLKAEVKEKLEEDFHTSRDWIQVLCNGGFGTVLCVLYDFNITSIPQNALLAGFLAFYATCIGDTWSSEVGILSKSAPRLITAPWRTVPPGTNGGISALGCGAAASGGFALGLVWFISSSISSLPEVSLLSHWLIIPLAALAGLLGSFLDSLFGATLQFSGYCKERKRIVSTPGPTVKHISGLSIIDNNTVNFISAVVVASVSLYMYVLSPLQ